MPQTDLRRLEDAFTEALERPESERAAFLAAACAGDAALLAAAERMLRAQERAGAFLAEPTAGSATAEGPGPAPSEAPGARIGPYKLLEQIGEGGFGVVFMAEQTEPVVRRVALKIIKAGMDTRAVIARFEAERQALAMMDHPNIARVLDAGATEAGRPYFVMELVRGDPITEYCDKNNRSTRERLDLFTDVCHAVQHAHQKGIIHRDIKPSNVLVTIFDGRPVPKVIDFGIAKAMSQRLTDKTLFTAHRQLIGTPQYMSPEQAELSGVDIDTRSDIYSLGVLLYELLTGTTPFDPEHLRSAALAEVQRIIREEEPEKPSTRLSQGVKGLSQGVKVSRFQGVKGKTPASPVPPAPSASPALDATTPRHLDTSAIAARRRTDAAQLARSVRGDLDWIVMKCLEKDRSRRYETANGLAADVQRHLASEPVIAAPPSRAYRLRRFVRRNRGAATAAGLVCAALVLGLAGTSAGLVRADQRRREAEIARKEADRRSEETARVAAFQARMLERIDSPEVGVNLMREIRERHRAALELAPMDVAARSAAAESLGIELARVNSTDIATALIDEAILQPAIRAIDEQFGDQPVVDATLRQTLADACWGLGLYDAAVPLQVAALATRRRVLGNDDPDTLESMYRAAQRLDPTEEFAKELLEQSREVFGADHAKTLTTMTHLANLMHTHGRHSEAEPICRQAVEGLRTASGGSGPLIEALDALGSVLAAQGRPDEAERCLREMLERSRRGYGDAHPRTIHSINNYSAFLFDQQRFGEVEPLAREALALARRVWGDDHQLTLSATWNLGFLLFIMGRPADAEPFYRELLERRERVMSPTHVDTMFSLNSLGVLLVDLERPEEAEPLLRDAADRRARVLGPEHADTLASRKDLAWALIAQGRLAEAESLLREVSAIDERAPGDSDTTLRCKHALGHALLELGRPAEAEPLLRAAAEGYFASMGDRRAGTIKARTALGVALTALARFPEAEAELLRAEDALVGALGVNPGHRRRCAESLVALYAAWDLADQAKGFGTKAQEWRARLDALPPLPQREP